MKTMKCDESGVEKTQREGKGKGREESHAADDKDTSSKILVGPKKRPGRQTNHEAAGDLSVTYRERERDKVILV